MTIQVIRKEKESIFMNNKYTFSDVEIVENSEDLFTFRYKDLGHTVKYPKSSYSYKIIKE